MFWFGIYMVNISFEKAVYLMHILVSKPVILLEDSITCLRCMYKRPCLGQFQWSIHILDYCLNLHYFGLKLIK